MTRKELINKYFNDKIIKDNLYFQVLLKRLKRQKITLEEEKILLSVANIEENKIIVISDTHLGSINENYEYLDLVYEFASKNNYHSILHGGDFMQGSCKPVNLYQRLDDQIYEAALKYPYDNYINNYILLGNHDYFLVRKYDDITSYFDDRKDINILGLKKVYLNWHNNLITLNHKVPKFDLDLPRIESLINFAGHRHEFSIIDNTIYIPTLSDDIKYYGKSNYPGFFTAEIIDDILSIEMYNIIDNKICNKKLVLQKSSNERVKVNDFSS